MGCNPPNLPRISRECAALRIKTQICSHERPMMVSEWHRGACVRGAWVFKVCFLWFHGYRCTPFSVSCKGCACLLPHTHTAMKLLLSLELQCSSAGLLRCPKSVFCTSSHRKCLLSYSASSHKHGALGCGTNYASFIPSCPCGGPQSLSVWRHRQPASVYNQHFGKSLTAGRCFYNTTLL